MKYTGFLKAGERLYTYIQANGICRMSRIFMFLSSICFGQIVRDGGWLYGPDLVCAISFSKASLGEKWSM